MKEIFGFIARFYKEINKPVLIACTLLTASLIYLNFHFDANQYIDDKNSVFASFYFRYLIFFIAFALPYIFYFLLQRKNYFKNIQFSFFIIIAPAIFSWKIAMDTSIHLSDHADWDFYWNQIIYWPVRLIAMSMMLFILWFIFYRNESFFGLTTKNFKWRPYLLMLIIMIPLIAAASTQQDFLNMYPKMKEVHSMLAGVDHNWIYKLLHELAYGTDFISVELFFRGFLIFAFIKIAGKDAILPMACFYCTIHFGKPLGECISSYFGGMLLGIVVFHTRSILGGLVVHLGIAWLMELGGAIGNSFN
jgi:hypothetical protein